MTSCCRGTPEEMLFEKLLDVISYINSYLIEQGKFFSVELEDSGKSLLVRNENTSQICYGIYFDISSGTKFRVLSWDGDMLCFVDSQSAALDIASKIVKGFLFYFE